MRAYALGAALLLAGCVVDVDLGRSTGEPVDGVSDAGLPLDADAIPLDAAPDGEVSTAPDVGPDASPDLFDEPDLFEPPDMGPELPDAALAIETCDDCIVALADTLDCPAEQPCVVEPVVAEICAALCDAPDDGSCDGCFASIGPLLEACVDAAPFEVCRALEGALLAQCETRCGGEGCGDCLGGITADCDPAAPFECTQSLVDAFSACFGVCDESVVFEGLSCAIDAGDAWTLCVHDAPAPCDEPLFAEVDLCRLRADSQLVPCMETCGALSGLRRESCALFGFDAPTCALRAQEGEVACVAECQGQLWGPCEPGAQTRAALCSLVEGPDCEALGSTIDFTCRGEAFGEGFCEDCLLQALVMTQGCEDVDLCVAALEDEWALCLDQCGGVGPQPGCLDCALAADDRLGGCVRDGRSLLQCLADREAEARGCAELCGDAIARAVPCTTRTDALFARCAAGPDPDPEPCFERAALFDAACHWFRLSVD